MRSFREQYIECEENGFHAYGEVEKFKDHPEMLPSPFHPAAPKIAQKLKEDPEFGLTPIMCLRFGGQCHSGHLDCRQMRNLKSDTV